MKYSLCFSGHMRTYEICLKSPHLEDLIEKANKVYVCTWEDQDVVSGEDNFSCYTNFNKNIKINLNKIKNLYKTEHVKILQYPIYNKKKYEIHNQFNFGKYESFLNMHYLIKECNEMVCDNSDILIRIRPDIFLTKKINLINKPLVFPKAGFLDGKYSPTDTFFYGNKNSIDRVSSFFNFSEKYILDFRLENWHERLFLKYLKDINIQYHFQDDVRYQIVRHDFLKDTLGFYDDDGNVEIIKINEGLKNEKY